MLSENYFREILEISVCVLWSFVLLVFPTVKLHLWNHL